jgi:peptidoglycan hydrolase CwlO-like protein
LNELQKDIEHLQNQITIIENNLEEEEWSLIIIKEKI